MAHASGESAQDREPNGRSTPSRTRLGGDGRADPAQLVQEEVARLRRGLLGGRGPGASEQETARYMGDRATVGAVPTVIERELVQVRADLARGDADAIEHDLRRARDNLAAGLDALGTRLAPRRLATQPIRAARDRCALLLGAPAGTSAPSTAATSQQAGIRPGIHAAGLPQPAQSPAQACTCGDAGDQWRRIAVRAAAAGAAATLGLELLARTVRRWRSQRAARCRDRTGRARPRRSRSSSESPHHPPDPGPGGTTLRRPSKLAQHRRAHGGRNMAAR